MPPGVWRFDQQSGAEAGEHRTSLRAVRNLAVGDFQVVLLETEGYTGAVLAEALLLEEFRPPWNAAGVEGFGSKPQGDLKGGGQTPAPWDRLHPGRPWVKGIADDASLAAARDALDKALGETRRVAAWVPLPDSRGCGTASGAQVVGERRDKRAPRKGTAMAGTDTARSEEVIKHLERCSAPATIGEVAEALDLTHRQARDTLAYLAKQSRVERVGRGTYRARPESPEPPKPPTRRAYGSVAKAAVAAVQSDPGAVWTAHRLADAIGITKGHATTVLSSWVKQGSMHRVGYGEYRTTDADLSAPRTSSHQRIGWVTVGTVEEAVLLRDREDRLWPAEPVTAAQLQGAA